MAFCIYHTELIIGWISFFKSSDNQTLILADYLAHHYRPLYTAISYTFYWMPFLIYPIF